MFSFKFLLLIAVLTTVSADPNRNEDTIFIRGKHFHKNGKSQASLSAEGQTPAQIYEQCMDHFGDPSCSQTWSQRYWVNPEYYQSGGPIFFYLGPEGDASGSVDTFYWLNYAQHYNALLVCIEHRFYGDSIPTNDTSLESLQLLTSQQALADAAKFIGDFKSTNASYEAAPVVVFGGSYGGNLAAWFRQKYPGSANVAVSSSGPLEAKLDFSGYMRTVSEVIDAIDPTCNSKILDTFTCMENLVHGQECSDSATTNSSGISKALHYCDSIDFNDEDQKEQFFKSLAMNTWATNYPMLDDASGICGVLDNQTGSDVLATYGSFLQAAQESGNCGMEESSEPRVSSYKRRVRNFLHSPEGLRSGAAGWFWQTCYEFGYFQTADPVHKVFGYDFGPLTYVEGCQEEFGDMFTAEYIEGRINQTNEYYKGKDNDGTCIIFVNGEYDPWHSLGINDPSETSSSNSVVTIATGQHCEDMGYPFYPNKQDTLDAQAKIQNLIGQYLSDPNCVPSS